MERNSRNGSAPAGLASLSDSDVPKIRGYSSASSQARRLEMGRRIRAAREKRGLLAQDLAAEMQVAPATVSGWEHGRHAPSLENLARIAEITGEPTSFLNPEALAGRGSIEQLARRLATALGQRRLEKLLEIPEKRLCREIDAILGSEVVRLPDRPTGATSD